MKEAGDLMSEQSQHIHFENTNRWSTKQLVTMALMCALGALFMYVQLPILPSAPFLTYDPSLVPAMVCGFAYGPGAGTAVAAMAIVIHALTTGDWVGALMNLVATLGYILPAAIVYQKMHTYKGAVIGLVFGVIAATALSMVANLTIGVWFWYGSVDVIAPLMIPAVLPFNLIKTVLNSVLTLAVYKAVSNLTTPKKDQVKGTRRCRSEHRGRGVFLHPRWQWVGQVDVCQASECAAAARYGHGTYQRYGCVRSRAGLRHSFDRRHGVPESRRPAGGNACRR